MLPSEYNLRSTKSEARRNERESPALMAHGPSVVREQIMELKEEKYESAAKQANDLMWQMQQYAVALSWA